MNLHRCRRLLRIALLASLAATLSACGLFEKAPPEEDPRRPAGPVVIEPEADRVVFEAPDERDPERDFEGSETFPGTGRFIDADAARRRPPPPSEEGEITLNFEGQGIQEVIHAILGHMLQENYVIAPGVGGQVTFSTARPIRRDQILPILEMLLRWNDATLVWRDDHYHVLPVSQAVRGNLVPRLGNPDSARGYEVMAVPLRYISPSKMAEILEPYVREDGVVNADNARSLLFLAGTPRELRNYMQIIQTFDVDWLDGMSVGIFELRRVEVGEVTAELEAVFGEGGETPLAGMFRFLPLERLNSVMVITPNDHYLKEAEKWIERLDRSSPEAGSRLFVYRVKNLDADILAGYLADLFGTGPRRDPRRERRGALAPGLEEARVTSVAEFQQQQREQPERRRDQPRETEGGLALGPDEDVRITAVMETNSLLIQASPSQYDAIFNAIERLDEEPLQVLIEAQVIEVTLNEALRYGVAWFISNTPPTEGGPAIPERFSTSRSQDRAIFGDSQNFLTTVTRRSLDRTFVTALIEALDTVSDTRTLSSPSLMVRNNAEARINVGRQIPVTTTSFTGLTDRVARSAQFIQTGVSLDVTPRVNPGGLVYLQVRQEVSSPGAPIEGQDNLPIDNRQISTEIAVQSGQTIVLGGLISEDNRLSEGGVPGLRRLPGIGPLFGSRRTEHDRAETLVLITPTVIETTRQLEDVSREFERKFKGLEPLRTGRRAQELRGVDVPR